MISPDLIKVPAQSQALLGKKVSDLISTDTKVYADGSVVGTLKYVDSYPQFSSVAAEKKGNYFPLKLTKTGEKMTIKKNGAAALDKTEMDFDEDIVLRVDGQSTTFTIEVDSSPVVTLNFKKATLAKS